MILSRCTQPTIAGRSAYTVLGFVGYVVEVAVTTTLAVRMNVPLAERAVIAFAPPLTFLAVIAVARRRVGYERIVFYEALSACLITGASAAWLIGGDVARTLDLITVGIGVFLVFGRLGCFRVGCCYGRLCRRGVRYSRAHVVRGFPAFWSGRPLVPVQLIEAAMSLVLVSAATLLLSGNGDAAALYLCGYGVVRFGLEHVRGDRDRRYRMGLSEAQRMAIVIGLTVAAWHPRWWTVLPISALVATGIALAATRNLPRRTLLQSGHVHELQQMQEQLGIATNGETSAGLLVTRHNCPTGGQTSSGRVRLACPWPMRLASPRRSIRTPNSSRDVFLTLCTF
jgi:hypothetical protein